jgi:predicted GIY-YIG superfamily endonuclease
MKNSIIIYTLQLENGFFYVGKTINFKNRLNQHVTGKGSEWTKINKVIKVIDQIEFSLDSSNDEDKWENFVTIKLMKKKGWMNVRGGFWCNTSEYETIKGLHHHNYFTDVKLNEIEYRSRKYIIYGLKLENDKYFIGHTTNLKYAIKNHTKEKASKWTNTNKPIKIIETWECKSNLGRIDIELVDEKVFDYFRKYSPENVRGGSFVSIDLKFHMKKVKLKWIVPTITKLY